MNRRNAIAGCLLLAVPTLLVAQEGWIKVTSRTQAVTLSVPQSYIVIDQNDPEFKARVATLKDTNPQMAASIERNMTQQYEFAASDTAVSSGDNFNVLVTPSQGLTPSMYGSVGKEILKQAPFNGKGKTRTVRLPEGSFLNYFSDVRVKDAAGNDVDLSISGYLTVKNDKMYIFTFTTGKVGNKEFEKTVDAIMKSVKILK